MSDTATTSANTSVDTSTDTLADTLTDEEKQEYIDTLAGAVKEAINETWTPENYKRIKKPGIALCFGIDVFLFSIISILTNVIIGIVLLVIFIICEYVGFKIIKMICRFK